MIISRKVVDLVLRYLLVVFAFAGQTVDAAPQTYTFGVLNQRSPVLTAQYWNPILDYVSKMTGAKLVMAMGKDVKETDDSTRRGEYDFVYTNHVIFTQENDQAGYKVILRPNEDAIKGQLVVAEDSKLKKLSELQGKEVGFPSKKAFVAYMVTMDHLVKNKIDVTPSLGGNQEGVMAQLKAGAVAAASVNSKVMRDYSERTGFRYRILWSSPDYLNLPIAAQLRVPADVVERVRKVLDKMDESPEGLAILKASAEVVHQSAPYGFRLSSDQEYESYRSFYKTTVLQEVTP
jgi:phosphonate transport system substrate-binding protein